MKNRLITQVVGCGLLGAAICIFTWQVTSAGSPPVRLALHQPDQVGQPFGEPLHRHIAGHGYYDPTWNSLDTAGFAPVTGLIPTYWESKSQLIPTEIEAQTRLVQRSLTDASPENPLESVNYYLNKQILTLTPRPSPVRVTGKSRVATVPQSTRRLKLTAPKAPQEEIPQQK